MSRKDSLTEISLRTHLNTRRKIHRGKGYDDLMEMIGNKASISYIARAFGVTRRTVYKWLDNI